MKVINDNRGFTLLELLVTIVVLALVMGITSFSISSVLNASKEEEYNVLMDNINTAVELYYQECRFSSTDAIECPTQDGSGVYSFGDLDGDENIDGISLGSLITYGYLKGDASLSLVDPRTNTDISSCEILFKVNNGKITISTVADASSFCPDSDDYN